jgi:cell division protein FtsB
MQHAQKTEEVNKQRETVEALENDPRTIEKVAREKYRFLKPGETIMLYPDGGEVPANPDVDM